jgi:hypothetical protein
VQNREQCSLLHIIAQAHIRIYLFIHSYTTVVTFVSVMSILIENLIIATTVHRYIDGISVTDVFRIRSLIGLSLLQWYKLCSNHAILLFHMWTTSKNLVRLLRTINKISIDSNKRVLLLNNIRILHICYTPHVIRCFKYIFFDERVKTLFLIKVGVRSFVKQSEAKKINGN